jgi:hypothetical protein
MLIYTNGCSHTATHSTAAYQTWPNAIINEFEPTDFLINEAKIGASNDYIFHKSLESITKLIEENMKPTYVFIQWSGPNRRMHCEPDGTILHINLFDNTELGIKFEPMASEQTIHYMFCLQEFLKQNKIEYRFFNYMGLDTSITKLSIFSKLDFKNIINFKLGDSIIYDGLIKYVLDNGLNIDKQGHPNSKGYLFIASHIMKEFGIEMKQTII